MSEQADLESEADNFRGDFRRLREAIGLVIVGQERVVDGVLTAVIAGGNVLLEGVPGLGKTELVKTLARALDLDFRRIQFTPDLMPADIIGTNIMTAGPDGRYAFEFRRGPIFTQLLLADEINRATPKNSIGAAGDDARRISDCCRSNPSVGAAVLRSGDAKPD
jgi:MoxR-like ATPase